MTIRDKKVWLLDIEALDGQGTPTILRYSNDEYEGDEFYDVRLKQPGLYQEGLFSGNVFPSSRSSFGVSQIINNDGALDDLVNYAIDGRNVTLSFYDGTSVIEAFKGVSQRFEFGNRYVSLRLRNPIDVLNISRDFNEYTGDNIPPNGLEGTEDTIKGNPKPRLYGEGRNIEPVLVNEQKLIYQVSDINATILKVYDSGNELENYGNYASLSDLENTPVNPDEWDGWLPPKGTYKSYQGFVRLGVQPSGTLSVDADGPQTLLGDVTSSIVTESGKSVSMGVTELNSLGNCRKFAVSEETYADMLDSLVQSAGAYWRILSSGDVEIGFLPIPNELNAVFAIEDYMTLNISRSGNGAGNNGLPVYRIEIKADRIESTQDNFVGVVGESFKQRLSQQYRKASAQDNSVRQRHILSEEFSVTSDLSSLTSAQTVANRLLEIVGVRRDTVEVEIALSKEVVDLPLLSTVMLNTTRLGYSDGRAMLVVQKTYNPVKNKLSLTLFG